MSTATTTDTGQTTSRRTTTSTSTTPATQTERSAANRLRSTMAAQNVPVAVTAGDKIEALRQWASGRCLSADRVGVYSRAEVGGGRGRRVMRAE